MFVSTQLVDTTLDFSFGSFFLQKALLVLITP